MRTAAIQMDMAWEDPQANYPRYAEWIRRATAAGADLVVLPEMFPTGFSMASDKIAEDPDGPSTTFLVEQATAHGVHVCGSVAQVTPGFERPTNTLVLAGPGGVEARYHKIHPFSYSGEDRHYSGGHEFCTVTIAGVRTTFFVCYDLRFADEFWATAADTDCYVVPACWPARRGHHWRTLLQARAIENQAYVVGVNRVGTDGNDLDYSGDSAIIDPLGTTLASAALTETMVLADVDAEEVATVRARFPFLADRR